MGRTKKLYSDKHDRKKLSRHFNTDENVINNVFDKLTRSYVKRGSLITVNCNIIDLGRLVG